MKTPQGGKELIDRLAKLLHKCYKYKLVRYIVAPLFISIPPGTITAFYGNQLFKQWLTELSPSVATYLQSHVVFWIFFAMMYPSLILAIASGVLQKAYAKTMTADWLHPLNAALDRVVGCKERRFSNHAVNMNLRKEDAFCAITNPELQIAELIRGVCEFFNTVRAEDRLVDDKARLIRVMVCEIEDGQITRIPINYPEDEPPPSPQALQLLNDQHSGIQTATRNRDIVVIQSVAAELRKPQHQRRFVDIKNDEDNIGSLICFPIIYHQTGEIPFVISIHCDEDNYFRETKKELYKCSLERFALRIRLEYSLLLMKEALCEY